MLKKLLNIFFVLPILLAALFSCEAEKINTDPNTKLSFSVDTLSFDTIFTDLGSATKNFVIYNTSPNKVNISSMRLVGCENYKLNINGVMANEVSDYIIDAKDSMYVFVQVFIDPNNTQTPFVVRDSVEFLVNTNKQYVKLEAFGRNAIRFNNKVIEQDTTLTSELPFLISDTLWVKPNVTLNIAQGTKLYFRKHAVLYVEGDIKANGALNKLVEFRGDRDDFMNTIPPLSYNQASGQWGGIVFTNTSKANEFNFVDIRNTEFGISIKSDQQTESTLFITNSILRNSTKYIIAAVNANITINNSLIYNSGDFSMKLEGGKYLFNHCTFGNYFKFSWAPRINPIFYYSNYTLDETTQAQSYYPFNSVLNNCIVYGGFNQEILYEIDTECGEPYSYLFKNCLLKMTLDAIDTQYVNCAFNKAPEFVFQSWKEDENPYQFDFHLQAGSGAIGIADIEIARQFPTDLDGKSRLIDGSPDAGCYEFSE